jgi:hypothetical protein
VRTAGRKGKFTGEVEVTKAYKQTNAPVRVYILKSKRWVTLKKHPGTKAKPFLKPALASNQVQIEATFKRELNVEVQKQWAKLATKMAADKRRVA